MPDAVQTISADPLATLLEAEMHRAIAGGADVADLAQLAVQIVLDEAVSVLEVQAETLRVGLRSLQDGTPAALYEAGMADGAMDGVARLLGMQFGAMEQPSWTRIG